MDKLIGARLTTAECKHENLPVTFDEEAAAGLPAQEIRRRWPRFHGPCPDCCQRMIGYASQMHYYAGDW